MFILALTFALNFHIQKELLILAGVAIYYQTKVVFCHFSLTLVCHPSSLKLRLLSDTKQKSTTPSITYIS